MEKSPVQLGVGTFAASAHAERYVLEALRSGRLSYGPFSRKFERAFAALHDSSYAVFVNSGTSALSIAVACLKETEGWKEGDEVIIPALTFVATANVVLEHGLKPVFVDCDPRTYNIDPALIEEKITPRTRAIIPVHLFGLVADMDPVLEIARKHQLKVIEDSCETLGVTYKGRKTGSLGDISCFSTYVAHLIVTGVGGLAVTKDARYAEILRSLANHGRDSIYMNIDDDRDIDGSHFREVIRRRFSFIRRGYSFRATELEAALGVAQLEDLPQTLQARRQNAAFLIGGLKKYEEWLQLPLFDPATHEHAFMMFPLVIRKDAPFTKEDLVFHLEQWNVETRDMLPLINQPVYKSFGIRPRDYPVANWVNTHGFYIGCHQGLGEKELKYVLEVFGCFFAASDSAASAKTRTVRPQ
ncbi:MAG: DegT/DnrJ/EryC1/StrS family aminotransferase [Candidatus Peribacteraceae bacterium]